MRSDMAYRPAMGFLSQGLRERNMAYGRRTRMGGGEERVQLDIQTSDSMTSTGGFEYYIEESIAGTIL